MCAQDGAHRMEETDRYDTFAAISLPRGRLRQISLGNRGERGERGDVGPDFVEVLGHDSGPPTT